MITLDFNRLDLTPGTRILDVGCGSGRHTGAAYRFPQALVWGTDLNRTDLAQGRQRLAYHDHLGEHGGGAWAFAAADALTLPFQATCFDLVICSEVLEHIPHHAQAIRELLRVLKAGGDLVVSVPRFLPERICWALSDSYSQANQGHVRIYRKSQLIQMVEQAGARHYATHYAHSLHTPYWWLKCLVGPTREDSVWVNSYHRFLVWDLMRQPRFTRALDRLLNPVLGKSLVLYFRKPNPEIP